MNALQFKPICAMTTEEANAQDLSETIERFIHPQPMGDYVFLIAPPCVTDNGIRLPCRLITWRRQTEAERVSAIRSTLGLQKA